MRSTTPFDRFDDLNRWLPALEDLGIDRHEFDTEYSLLNNVRLLGNAQAFYRKNSSTDLNGPAAAIAADPQSIEHILERANLAAAAITEDHRGRVLELMDKATDRAMKSAADAFQRRGDSILDTIRPSFDTLAARITAARVGTPDGVANLEDATRLGLSDTWLQLETDIAQWKQLSTMIDELFENGILSRTGSLPPENYYSIHFMVDDPDAYREVAAHSIAVHRVASAIAASGPHLRTIAQIDEHGTARRRAEAEPLGKQEARSWQANERDRQARGKLPLPAKH